MNLQQKTILYVPESGLSLDTEPASTLFLDFPEPASRNTFLLFVSHVVCYFVTAARTEQDKF